MAVSFPSNPIIGDTYTDGGKTWTYNGYAWLIPNINSPTVPTNTSDLINDGEDQINPFITLADVPASTNGLPAGGTAGQILTKVDSVDYNATWQENYADWTSTVKHTVRNNGLAGTITKGTAVYVTGSNGTNKLVGRASNTSEATSSKTMGLLQSDLTTTGGTQTGFVVTEGLLGGLNTAGQTAGDPVWLGVNGALIYGLVNKPYAPAHLVFIGIVTKVSAGSGEIFIKVQNGFELKEIHDVDVITTVPINGHILGYDGTLWVNKTIAGWLGFTPVPETRTLTINGTSQDLSADRTFTIATGLTVGTTPITSGTIGRVLFEGTGNVLQQSANLFWDNTNGRLGIGTASPLSKLHLIGTGTTSATTSFTIQNSSSATIFQIKDDGLCEFVNNNSYVKINNLTFAKFGSYQITGGNNAFINLDSSPNLQSYFGFGNGITMTIDTKTGDSGYFQIRQRTAYGTSPAYQTLFQTSSNGNVLINTTTDAGFKLDVNGTARVQGDVQFGLSGALDTNFSFSCGTRYGGQAKFSIIGQGATGSYIGIGSGASATTGDNFVFAKAYLNEYGNNVYGFIGVSNTTPMTFRFGALNSSVEAMRLTNTSVILRPTTGNVLIGTTTDAGFRLDVNGTARVVGELTLNSSIRSTQGNNLNMLIGNFALQLTSTNPQNTSGSLITTGDITRTDTGTKNIINVNNLVSSTAVTFNVLNGYAFTSTISQTQGTIRGLFISPTLTASTDFRAIETTVGNVLFGASGTGFFWDNANGRLGIGTASPTRTLDLRGVANIQVNSGSFVNVLTVENTGFSAYANKNVAAFIGNRGNSSNIDDNTNIGIQQKNTTVNNYAVVNFYNSTGNLSSFIGTQFVNHGTPTAHFILGTANGGTATEKMRIVSNGNVLIGTTTDAGFKLDVNGNTRVTGTLTTTSNVTIGSGPNTTGNVLIGRAMALGYIVSASASSLNSFILGGSGNTINQNSFTISSGGYNNVGGNGSVSRYVLVASPSSIGANSVTNIATINAETLKLNDGTSSGINSFYNAGIITIDLCVMEVSTSGNSNVYVGQFAFRFKRYLINGVGTFTDISAVTNLYNSADATLVGTTLTAVANGTNALDLRVTLPATANTANYRMGANVTITKVNNN